MGKIFSLITGLVFLGFAAAGLFNPNLEQADLQIILHIALGLAGVVSFFRYSGRNFARIVAVATLVPAALGFLGVKSIFGLLNLTILTYWLYFAIGLLAVWVYLTLSQVEKAKDARERERTF